MKSLRRLLVPTILGQIIFPAGTPVGSVFEVEYASLADVKVVRVKCQNQWT